jgi:hypothetical protein
MDQVFLQGKVPGKYTLARNNTLTSLGNIGLIKIFVESTHLFPSILGTARLEYIGKSAK